MARALAKPGPASGSEPPWFRVWELVRPRYEQTLTAMAPGNEAGLRQELIFCLLSGHSVTYELARSATDIVITLSPFDQGWSEERLRQRLEQELSTPQFDPRRRDGSLRRYRFPRRRADLLARACEWVNGEGGLRAHLSELGSEHRRRQWLCRCPGVGMKTASWYLRNVAGARELAILDVHVIRAMRAAGRLDADTSWRYLDAERAFLNWCEELEAPAAAFDLFLWDWQRSGADAEEWLLGAATVQ